MRSPLHVLLVLFVGIAFWLFPHKIVAQSYGSYENFGIDSTKIYLDSAKAALPQSPLVALESLNRALELAILNRNKSGEAKAYLEMASIQRRLKRFAEAQANLNKCKALFEKQGPQTGTATNSSYSNPATNSSLPYSNSKIPPTFLIDAHILSALIFEEANEFDSALSASKQCLNLLEAHPNNRKNNNVLRLQGRIYSKTGKSRKATKQLATLLSSEQNTGDQNGECETLIDLANAYARSEELSKAKPLLEKAIQISKANGYQAKNVRASKALAQIYKKEGDLENELNIRNSVVSMTDSSTNVEANFFQNIAIGNAYLNSNNLDSAEKYVKTGVDKITNVNNGSTVSGTTFIGLTEAPHSSSLQVGADAYRELAEGYLKKQKLEKALEYYKKYAILQDSVKEVQGRELEEAIALSINMGKNEERLQLLERERDLTNQSIALLQQDQVAKNNQIFGRNLIIAVLGLGLLLALVAGFILVKNTRARRRADKLLALQSMSGQMNPHFIFNALNSVNEYISQNDERAANRYLTAFSRLMRKVMDDSKQTFIPLNEEVEMLQLYLSLEHSRFKDQFEYSFEVDETLDNSEFQLPPMMVQPYIENAIWHGLRYREGSGHLEVRFFPEGENLLITIADNGIGIEKSKALKTKQQKKQHSLGMKNIGTRMTLMNEIYATNMEVQFSETHPKDENPGTTVRLCIPQHQLSKSNSV